MRPRDRRLAARVEHRRRRARRSAVSAVGGSARQDSGPRRTARTTRTRDAFPTTTAPVRTAAHDEGRAHAAIAGAAQRSERDVPADLHRRPAAACRSESAWNGYSTAAWEGDTLVVQTIGFSDGLWLDMGGNPMTDAAKMTERIRRPNYGTLGDADHHRRPEGVHTSMDGRDDPEDHARYRTDRRDVPREREVVAADAGITMRRALLIAPAVRETRQTPLPQRRADRCAASGRKRRGAALQSFRTLQP